MPVAKEERARAERLSLLRAQRLSKGKSQVNPPSDPQKKGNGNPFTNTSWERFLTNLRAADGKIPAVCAQPDMPSIWTVYHKMKREPHFAALVERIRQREVRKVTRREQDKRQLASDVWDVFLMRLRPHGLAALCKLPGMPTIGMVYKKRRDDPDFDRRMSVILMPKNGRSKKGRSGHPITDEQWEKFLAQVDSCWIKVLCQKPGMPSQRVVLKRCAADQEFAARMRSAARARIETKLKRARDYHRSSARRRARSTELPPAPDLQHFSEREILVAVRAALPVNLTAMEREEITADIVLAIYEGSLEVAELKKMAKEFVTAHRRLFGVFNTKSLDAKMFDDGNGTLGDMITYDNSVV